MSIAGKMSGFSLIMLFGSGEVAVKAYYPQRTFIHCPDVSEQFFRTIQCLYKPVKVHVNIDFQSLIIFRTGPVTLKLLPNQCIRNGFRVVYMQAAHTIAIVPQTLFAPVYQLFPVDFRGFFTCFITHFFLCVIFQYRFSTRKSVQFKSALSSRRCPYIPFLTFHFHFAPSLLHPSSGRTASVRRKNLSGQAYIYPSVHETLNAHN